jgi:hypothetical protein
MLLLEPHCQSGDYYLLIVQLIRFIAVENQALLSPKPTGSTSPTISTTSLTTSIAPKNINQLE